MKTIYFICLFTVLSLSSCKRPDVELSPVINTKDSSLTLIYKNNLSKDIIINKEVVIKSNIKSIDNAEDILPPDPYLRDARLTDIIPYNKNYNAVLKENFPFLLNNGDYLKSISTMNDQIIIINKNEIIKKVYKIKDYKQGDKLKLSLKKGLGLTNEGRFFIFNDSIKINEIKILNE